MTTSKTFSHFAVVYTTKETKKYTKYIRDIFLFLQTCIWVRK